MFLNLPIELIRHIIDVYDCALSLYAVSKLLHKEVVYLLEHKHICYPIKGREVMAYIQPLFSPGIALSQSIDISSAHPLVRTIIQSQRVANENYEDSSFFISSREEMFDSTSTIRTWKVLEINQYHTLRFVDRKIGRGVNRWNNWHFPKDLQQIMEKTENTEVVIPPFWRMLVLNNRKSLVKHIKSYVDTEMRRLTSIEKQQITRSLPLILLQNVKLDPNDYTRVYKVSLQCSRYMKYMYNGEYKRSGVDVLVVEDSYIQSFVATNYDMIMSFLASFVSV